MTTATTARIRRCIRDSEYAVAQDPLMRADRPDAKPVGEDDFTIDSFFDETSHAQALLEEKFSVLSSSRRNEAAESADPLRIGTDIQVAPSLPFARMVDRSRGLDATLMIKGLSVNTQTERNSSEASG